MDSVSQLTDLDRVRSLDFSCVRVVRTINWILLDEFEVSHVYR